MNEQKLVVLLRKRNETISTMESCTAGYLATTITNIDGSSEILKFSAITYSNEFKIKMGVNKKIIDKYSVYSFEVSREMSKCISKFANSTYGIGITGKINREYPYNLNGSNNEIFVTIYNSKTKEYNDILINTPNKKREECKKYITNRVIEEFLLFFNEKNKS